jgi:hypothetical protein
MNNTQQPLFNHNVLISPITPVVCVKLADPCENRKMSDNTGRTFPKVPSLPNKDDDSTATLVGKCEILPTIEEIKQKYPDDFKNFDDDSHSLWSIVNRLLKNERLDEAAEIAQIISIEKIRNTVLNNVILSCYPKKDYEKIKYLNQYITNDELRSLHEANYNPKMKLDENLLNPELSSKKVSTRITKTKTKFKKV